MLDVLFLWGFGDIAPSEIISTNCFLLFFYPFFPLLSSSHLVTSFNPRREVFSGHWIRSRIPMHVSHFIDQTLGQIFDLKLQWPKPPLFCCLPLWTTVKLSTWKKSTKCNKIQYCQNFNTMVTSSTKPSVISGVTTSLIEILWSDLTFKQQSSWIYRSAGTPVLLLSRPEYLEVALECLQSGKSRKIVA